MKTRIEELLAHFEMSPSKFADELGIQRSGMSHILSGRNKPSLELMQKVLARFPEVSTDWLISGKGEMLVSAVKAVVAPVIIPATVTDTKKESLEEKPVATETKTDEHTVKAPEVVIPTPEEPKRTTEQAYKPLFEPIIKQPQVEKVILPREQLALFDVPAMAVPVSIPESTGLNQLTQTVQSNTYTQNVTQQNVNKEAQATTNTYPPQIAKEVPVTPQAQVEMARAIATVPSGKQIERIVVFYSDKTFSAYSPE